MTPTMLKNNVILIITLCIGIILIHNSSGVKVKKDIDLYYDYISPQCRSVLLTLEALDLEINFINTSSPDQKKLAEAFLKKNSLVTLPVIQDGDFVLPESHAIIVYLVRKYGGEDDNPLYPNDPKIQAQVNQILYLDSGTLYPAFKNQYNPHIYYKIELTEETEDKIHEALEFLENVLKESTWTAGDSMTVADFSLVTSISTLQVFDVDFEMYEFINEWLTRCSSKMQGYEMANNVGIALTRSLLKSYRKAPDDLSEMDSP